MKQIILDPDPGKSSGSNPIRIHIPVLYVQYIFLKQKPDYCFFYFQESLVQKQGIIRTTSPLPQNGTSSADGTNRPWL